MRVVQVGSGSQSWTTQALVTTDGGPSQPHGEVGTGDEDETGSIIIKVTASDTTAPSTLYAFSVELLHT